MRGKSQLSCFVYDQPVVGAGAFYGRQSLLRGLVDGLNRGRSFAVCGGPGTGRTSTLLQVIHNLKKEWQKKPQATKVVPVCLDLAPCAAAGWSALPDRLWEKINEALRDPAVCGATPPGQPAPRPPGGQPAAFSAKRGFGPGSGRKRLGSGGKIPSGFSPRTGSGSRQRTFETLAGELRSLWQGLRGTEAWCEWGLLLDNADLLFGRELAPALFPLSDLVCASGDWAPKALLAAGGRQLREHLLDAGAELGFLRTLFLGALREPEAERLIGAGLPEAPPDLVKSLLVVSGKHPQVLQRLSFELETQTVEIGVEGAVDLAAEDCLQLFERIWREFDLGRGVPYRGAYAAPEHALMQLLLDFGAGCDLKTAEKELGIRPLKEYAELLAYTGVGEHAILGDIVRWRAHFDLWNIWYAERVMR